MTIATIKNATVSPTGRVNGQIFNDQSGRFNDGDWISTSPIQIVKTLNTEYVVEFKA